MGGGRYEFLPYFEEKRELISPYLDYRFLHVASVYIYIYREREREEGLSKKKTTFLPTFSQIWLSPLMDDCQFTSALLALPTKARILCLYSL